MHFDVKMKEQKKPLMLLLLPLADPIKKKH